jgi:hypothetical protein
MIPGARWFTLMALAALLLPACLEAPPKLAVIPSRGLPLRVHIFGADAKDGRSLFDTVAQINPSLSFVLSGGQGEVLLGLDRDPVPCVEPTGYCEYRVALRVRDAGGATVVSETTRVGASSPSCYLLCKRALQKAVIHAVERAATALTARAEAAGSDENDPAAPRGGRRRHKPPVCGVALGQRLPSEEAELRLAQIDALRRQGVLSVEEFECLRRAFLARL